MPDASVASLVGMHTGFDEVRTIIANGSPAHVVSGHHPATLDRCATADDSADAEVAHVGRLRS